MSVFPEALDTEFILREPFWKFKRMPHVLTRCTLAQWYLGKLLLSARR